MAPLRRLCGLLRNPRPYRERITADIRLRFTLPKCSATPRTSYVREALDKIDFRVPIDIFIN